MVNDSSYCYITKLRFRFSNSGTLADVTGIPHNIVYTPGAGVASFSEIEEGLRMLAPLLANLENAMIR